MPIRLVLQINILFEATVAFFLSESTKTIYKNSVLFAHVRFWAPPPKVRLFWLELPLTPSISILVKFKEKKLMGTSIFGWTQRAC